eukprot:1929918-Amphidinium_carterae.1
MPIAFSSRVAQAPESLRVPEQSPLSFPEIRREEPGGSSVDHPEIMKGVSVRFAKVFSMWRHYVEELSVIRQCRCAESVFLPIPKRCPDYVKFFQSQVACDAKLSATQ